MILPIYIYGQPVLRKVAEDITPDYPELKQLISNMYETLVVIDLDVLSEDFPEYKGFRKAFINAHIIERDEESKTESLEEGCLSIPGISEKVTRPTRIHVKYLDEEYQEHDEWVEGYLARVMQHEFDHLEGTMFVDRISPLRKNMIAGKLKNIIKGKFRCAYRTKIRR